VKTNTINTTCRDFLESIERRFAAQPEGQLCKLEISRDGGLLAQLKYSSGQTWVRWRDGEIDDLHPGLDSKIPLAAILGKRETPAHLKILNYRPGRRLVLLDRGGQIPRVLKGYRKRKAAEIFTRYELAAAALKDSGINAPVISNVDAELACLTMVREAGGPLCLSSGKQSAYRLIGEALARFQGHTENTGMETYSHQDELNTIDKLADRQGKAGLPIPEKWSELRNAISTYAANLPAVEAGLCHRDLYDKQFIQREASLTLLDFDLMCVADTALDPANFVAHMSLRRLQASGNTDSRSDSACCEQFLQGLNRSLQAGFRHRFHFYQAATFCRLALVYSLRPPWLALVPDLIKRGTRSLDNLNQLRALR